MRGALRMARCVREGPRKLCESRASCLHWQRSPSVYGGMNLKCSLTLSTMTLDPDPLKAGEPKQPNVSISQQIQNAAQSKNGHLAFDLLRTMIDNENKIGSENPKFSDFVRVITTLRRMNGIEAAEMASYTLCELSWRIEERRLASYHDISRLVAYVLNSFRNCIPSPKRLKLKHVEQAFNVSQQASSLLASLENLSFFTPSLFHYNCVLDCYAHTSMMATKATQAGAKYQEGLHLAIMASEAAENVLTRVLESIDGRELPDYQSWRLLLMAWSNVPSPDASDKVLWILSRMEEYFEFIDATIYNMVFNSLAQVSRMVEYDPVDPSVPVNKAIALLHRLVTSPTLDGPQRLDAMSYASIINAFAKTTATRDFGELAPANLAEACLRQLLELHQAGIVREGPNAYCYGYVVTAWTRHVNINEGALKSELALHRLEAHVGQQTLREPSRRRFASFYNMVLRALSKSTLEDAPERAEAIFSRMESSRLICVVTAEALIAAWAENPHVTVDRAERAQRCLSRIQFPSLVCYHGTLAACSANAPEFAENGLAVAETVFARMESRNPASYELMMAVYNKLLSEEEEERSRCLKRVFFQSCKEGLVTQETLKTLETGISKAEFEELLLNNDIEKDHSGSSFYKLPWNWTWKAEDMKRRNSCLSEKGDYK